MSEMELKSSGVSVSMGEGLAVRDSDDGKSRPDLISPFMLDRLGHWLRMGAKRYSERNWESGMPYSRCWASLMRHAMKWGMGMRDEDHLSAIIFNAMAIIHFEETKKKYGGVGFDDMPKYWKEEEK